MTTTITTPTALAVTPASESACVLLRAADYIAEHGWCRNTELDCYGRSCLRGAIRRANGVSDRTCITLRPNSESFAGHSLCESVREAWRALRTVLDGDPVVWNDHWCTDAKAAIATLHRAAAYIELGENRQR